MKTCIFETTIELEITVEYIFSPACKGSRDSLNGVAGAGPPLEPDEPAELEIEDVKIGEESILHLLSKKEIDRLQKELEELQED